jgi:hypothetical protein
MHLRLVLNLLHFLPDVGALYALRSTLTFYEIHPRPMYSICFSLVFEHRHAYLASDFRLHDLSNPGPSQSKALIVGELNKEYLIIFICQTV